MCYFVEQNIQRKELEKRFGIPMLDDPRYMPGFFHSAFTKPYLPVITSDKSHEIQLFQWGLIPSWVKDLDTAEKIRIGTFNAKSETAWEKPSFRTSIRNKRCMVLSHGFFEYYSGNKLKTPYYIKLKNDQIFAFAGLFNSWVNPLTGEIFNTFSILTTSANPLLEKIHNLKKRMPVILQEESEKDWIRQNLNKSETDNFLKPFPENEMTAYTVSRKISSRDVNINDPGLIEFYNYENHEY